MTQIIEDIHFASQAQYLLMLEGDFTLEITFYLTSQISDDIHFAWQAQYLVRLAGDFS